MARTEKLVLLWLLVTAALLAVVFVWFKKQDPEGKIPDLLAGGLPASCKQVVLVEAANPNDIHGKLWLLQRKNEDAEWSRVSGPMAVVIGRSGLAWGLGEHPSSPPHDFRSKKEGDGCSPAGIFRLPFAFGASAGQGRIKLPYTHVTMAHQGVDDPQSRFYNQVVDTTQVQPDWKSHETMLREDGLYDWGAFVAHNPQNLPHKGSCIFLHLWRGPHQGTAGCTAMSENDLLTVLEWLDPSKDPRLVQCLKSWR